MTVAPRNRVCRFTAWAGVVLLMAVPAGCRRTSTRVALLTPTTGVMLWDTVRTGAVLEGRTCAVSVHYDGPAREDDLRTQLAEFQQAAETHFQVVAIAPIQMQAFRNPVERAARAGTPVIVIGNDLGIRSPDIAYILSDDDLAGRLAADKLAELLHGSGSIAVMGIDLGQPGSVARERALEQELSDRFDHIHVVRRETGTINLFQEQQSATDMLEDSVHIDAIVALSASATRGAFYALKSKYLHPPLHLIGFDQDLIAPLAHRQMDAVIGLRAYDIGQLVARLACERAHGENWGGPYILRPVVLTPDNYRSPGEAQQLQNGGWWDPQQ